MNGRRSNWTALAKAGLALAQVVMSCSDPPVPGDAAFARCPNAVCEAGESAKTCPGDCPACMPSDCMDTNPCTVDTCDPKVGCSNKPVGGGPCDNGPCFEGGACIQGQCVASPRLWDWSHDYGDGKKDVAAAVVRDIDGGLLVAIETWHDEPIYGKQRNNYVLRVPAAGPGTAVVPTKIPLAADAKTDDALAAMAPLVGGGALAVGSKSELLPVNGNPPRTKARFAVVQGAGSQAGGEDDIDIDGNHWFASVDRANNGTLLAVGGLDNQGLAKRFFADGEPSWNLTIPGPGATAAYLRAVAATGSPSTAWIAVGRAEIAGKLHGWAVGLPALSTDTWSKPIAADGGWHGALLSVAAAPDGGALALGMVCDCWFGFLPELATARLWLVRLDGSGNVLWQRRGEQERWPNSLFALPGGDRWLAVTSLRSTTSPAYLSLLTLSPDGVELAATPVLAPSVMAAALLPDATVALVGQTAVQNQGDVWIARLDRWGNAACAASGGCLASPAQDCGDGNACTADACQQGKCVQTSNPSGVGCGIKGKCQGNTCEIP